MSKANYQRELLIKYLAQSASCGERKSCEECPYNNETNCIHAQTADKLLSNNVIALPCKIGGQLWCVVRRKDPGGKEKRVITIIKTRRSKHNILDVIKGCGTKYYRRKEQAQKAGGVKCENQDNRQSKKRSIHICNDCYVSASECPWKSSLTPVEGWTARKIKFNVGNKKVDTYKVTACPLYKENKE